jgi:c-di-GMP-binding flagellar brake protein YcgR
MEQEPLAARLSVGQPVIIELNADGGEGRHPRVRSTIRGWSDGQYVLLDWPDESGESARIGKHMPCFVRYLHEGCACGFACRVAEQELVRRAQFEVTWPMKFEVMRIRQHDRIGVNVHGTIYSAEGKPLKGEVVDISIGGCRLMLEQDAAEGDELDVTFPLHPGLEIERVPVHVCSVQPHEDLWAVGCEFGKLDARTRHDIEFFIATAEERVRGMRLAAKRVLVLEEDFDQLAGLRQFLAEAGYEVATAASLVDAFYRLRLYPPDAFIVRGNLKELPAGEVCRIVRNTRGCGQLPIILSYLGPNEKPPTNVSDEAQGTAATFEETRMMVAALVPDAEDSDVEA